MEEKWCEFTLPGTKSDTLQGCKSGTLGSFSHSGTIEPLTAVPHYLSSNLSDSSRSSTPSLFPSTSANALASTSTITPPVVHNSSSLNEFNLKHSVNLGNDPEDVVVFRGGDDKDILGSSDLDSESGSLPEEKSKEVPSLKAKCRESWDNDEPLTPEEWGGLSAWDHLMRRHVR